MKNKDERTAMKQTTWKQLYTPDGKLIYEGNTINDKPYGEGTVYFHNGKTYQQGLFDVKGLIKGKEYYPNGNLRFKGTYQINKGYGPNYPIQGICYDREGLEIFNGILSIRKSGLGYPFVDKPEGFGQIPQPEKPDFPVIMWEDLNQEK